MIKILYYLLLTRFRKWVSMRDYLAMILLLLFYLFPFVLFYLNFETYKNYYFVFLFDIVFKHLNRTDVELLKLNKNYKSVLFLENLIYVFPLLVVLSVKMELVLSVSVPIFLLILTYIPKLNFKTIPYPFQLFSPFWHITFRKYKLIYVYLIIPFLLFVAIEYDNENIIYFALILLGLISCVPSFERERLEEIKQTPFESKKYLFCQFKNSIINTSYLIMPIALVLFLLSKWDMLMFLIVVILIPIVNILLKYTFFSNSFLHQLVFTFFIILSITMFGIPLLTIPFLYGKSIKTINIIKYANH